MSEGGIGTKEQTSVRSLNEKMWVALEKQVGRDRVNPKTRRQQELLLMKLPENFESVIREHTSKPDIKNSLEKGLFGKVFEELVRVDERICQEEESGEAKLLRAILNDPNQFGLKENGIDHRMRNLDIVWVDQRGKIVGAVEAKSGKIGSRGSDQVGRSFENLKSLVGKLKLIDPKILRDHGLGEIADNLDSLEVSDKFSITLAVPAFLYDEKMGPESLLDEEELVDNAAYRTAADRVKKCTILSSPFSRREVHTMTQVAMNWLQNEVPKK